MMERHCSALIPIETHAYESVEVTGNPRTKGATNKAFSYPLRSSRVSVRVETSRLSGPASQSASQRQNHVGY